MPQITAGSFCCNFKHLFADFDDQVAGVAGLVGKLRPETFVFEQLEMDLLVDGLKVILADPFFSKIFVHDRVKLFLVDFLVAVFD
jgi:hypothetical protein